MGGAIKFFIVFIVGFIALYGIYSDVSQLRNTIPVTLVGILFGLVTMVGFIGMIYGLRRNPALSKRLR